MALFKFRQGGESSTPATRPAESIEAMRQRAKHRLIGAAVLVLIGVVGFPLLFDTQPRPIPVDIRIDIPDKSKVPALQIPAAALTTKPAVSAGAVVPEIARPVTKPAPPKGVELTDDKVSAAASLDAKEQLIPAEPVDGAGRTAVVKTQASTEPKVEPKPGPRAEPKLEPRPEPKAEPKPEPKTEQKADKKTEAKAESQSAAKSNDAARAKSLLEGREPGKAVSDAGRFVVQVGAFSDLAKAREARHTLEKAGLKSYTHVAETKDGPRTRVRLGPFGSRAEAEKAATKVKSLSLPAAILTL